MARKFPTTSVQCADDLYDYARLWPRRKAAVRDETNQWRPVVTDDWPAKVPITQAELDVFEAHFTGLLDELFAPKR